MALGEKNQGLENASPQMDLERSYLPSPTGTNNIMWETASVCMSMDEEAIRKSIGRFNTPVECWGCTNSPRYHADRFHTYRNCPNKRDPDVDERKKSQFKSMLNALP